jgi:hypothetical protein
VVDCSVPTSTCGDVVDVALTGKSETMVPYLRLMGLSEMAIEAWTKAERETDTYKVSPRWGLRVAGRGPCALAIVFFVAFVKGSLFKIK